MDVGDGVVGDVVEDSDLDGKDGEPKACCVVRRGGWRGGFE